MADSPMLPDQGRDSADLCVACGMCCDGTLFVRAKARDEELARMAALGLATERDGDQAYFRLPCAHHSAIGCTIYADRFHVCGKFRCALLVKLEAGEVAAPEALRLVGEAKRLVGRAAARDPALSRIAARRAVQRAGLEGGAGDKVEAARTLLDVVALETFLDRHFRKLRKPPEPAGG